MDTRDQHDEVARGHRPAAATAPWDPQAGATAETPAVLAVRGEGAADWLLELAQPADGSAGCLCFEDEFEGIVVFPILGGTTRIGRGLAADVPFDDPTVSRRHALVVRDADGAWVLDDRSLNGVFVNGRRVRSHLLEHGDEIRIGRHRLRYAAAPSGAEARSGTIDAASCPQAA